MFLRPHARCTRLAELLFRGTLSFHTGDGRAGVTSLLLAWLALCIALNLRRVMGRLFARIGPGAPPAAMATDARGALLHPEDGAAQ